LMYLSIEIGWSI